jgi:hypothetical protein
MNMLKNCDRKFKGRGKVEKPTDLIFQVGETRLIASLFSLFYFHALAPILEASKYS